MYAIIKSGSKQYRVEKNSEIDVEKISLRPRAKTITLDEVLLLSAAKEISVGRPYLKNVSIKAEVIAPIIKADKVIAFKFRRRKDSHWKKGHRQKLTRLKIKEITVS
ncbi:MAG: 50S ribosomal protein L21 [Candidatus Omnitrophica bacterium]|nr:50S ribosomal protein L21 [Candidatus Omnitrophota bacterium]